MNIHVQAQAVTQAIAKIHWSIAYVGLDSILEESPGAPPPVDLLAAIRLVDESLAELRQAYGLAATEARAIATRVFGDGKSSLENITV